MIAFYVALVVGTVVAGAYLDLVYDGFQRARREYENPTLVLDDAEVAESYERQGRGFSWVAGGGVVVSSTLLIAASVTGAVWYLLPFLGIGTAIAVVVAFLYDRGDLNNLELYPEEAKHR